MGRLAKLRAVVGIATEQLRHDRTRTVLAIIGVTLAVLAATLLGSVGYGVIATGEEKFDTAGRDLWITGGPVQITPGAAGGFQSSIHDSHTVSQQIEERETVQTAVPMLFQTVYLGNSSSSLNTVVAVGVPSSGGATITAGDGFSRTDRAHYANGNYSGPPLEEVIVDQRIASQYGLSVNESVHIGGTVAGARQTNYTVVGVSPTFSRFLGTSTVAVPLSELQTMTGAARTDRATFITVSLRPDANVSAVEADLEQAYPTYDIRTNREQLQAVLAEQIVVIASGVTLVVLAILAGLVLTINLLALLVYQQRESLAALRSMGVSTTTLAGVVGSQGLILGILGGGLGLILTPAVAALLNRAAMAIVGFEGLVRTPDIVFAIGAVIAVVIGTLSAIAAGWQVARVNPLEHLGD